MPPSIPTPFLMKHLLLYPLASLALVSTAHAETGLARHKQLYAVPAPARVVVDGQLDEWDLSGQIDMFVVSESKDTQSARFGANVVNDMPNESRLEPAQWGKATAE